MHLTRKESIVTSRKSELERNINAVKVFLYNTVGKDHEAFKLAYALEKGLAAMLVDTVNKD